ncbi:MAG: AMP-binding protein, partial [Gammaproteobacteria bacterium]|nr:AMP-binding protein [Gammaproteobacteria bacterium]
MSNEDFNLYSHFQRQFDVHGDKELIRDVDDRAYRYVDIAGRSGQIAAYLKSIGAVPGDRVTVQVEKSVECLCLYLACLRGGFVFHPLNLAYTKSELDYFLGNAEPKIVVCDPGMETSIKEILAEAGTQNVLTLDANGKGTLAAGADQMSTQFKTLPRNHDDLAALLYSSGTTGVPKGIMLTHANLLRNTEALVEAWGFSSEDRLLHALPIFHVHGLFVAIGCVLLSGASMRWLPAYDATKIIRLLPECSVLMGVPTYYTRLLAQSTFDKEVAGNVR